jgi:hypothetical protein
MARRKKPAIEHRDTFRIILVAALATELAKVAAKEFGAMLEAILDLFRNLF